MSAKTKTAHQERIEALAQAKAEAIIMLREYGSRIAASAGPRDVVRAVRSATGRQVGGQTQLAYLQAFIEAAQQRGEVAPPRTPTPFRDLKLSPALRLNFERAARHQPKLHTPSGYGGYTRSWGGDEGRS